VLVDNHVIEGITALARHPAGPECATSANAGDPDATFPTRDGEQMACFPSGCTMETEANSDPKKRVCYYATHCNFDTGKCEPNTLGQTKCDEALFDVDDLDEGDARYFEQNAPTPLRLARYTQPATGGLDTVNAVWEPRVKGAPFSPDGGWQNPENKPLTALLDALVVPEGVHTFKNGEPCESFDAGTYLSNLTARFFMTDGADVYYLSHPTTHRCLGSPEVTTCGYLKP
jgi:hypothetical protein